MQNWITGIGYFMLSDNENLDKPEGLNKRTMYI